MNIARTTVLLLTLAAYVAAESRYQRGSQGERETPIDICLQETGLRLDSLRDVFTGKPTPEILEFWCCIFKKFRLYNEDGTRDFGACEGLVDRYREPMEERGVNIPDVRTCCSIDSGDCGERAFSTAKCFMTKAGTAISGILKSKASG
ncbi:hypothetical protein R5R35_000948 [Gryllus longicercus]|uniref:Odorant binding protein n=1 Tax=Gryllus longicercus TaxID=2509291 RepID=A0AAN9Z2F4_9ORTH